MFTGSDGSLILGEGHGPRITYEVSTSYHGPGAISADVDVAAEGDTVTITVVPDEGSRLACILAYDAQLVPGEDGTYTFVMPARSVEVVAMFEKAATEHSSDVKAALRADGSGVYLMLIAGDNRAIPSGTVTVSYTYTAESVTPFGRSVTLQTGTMSVSYDATDRAYAYIGLDFSDEEHYGDIVGASAVFTAGGMEYKASTVAFTLPERA